MTKSYSWIRRFCLGYHPLNNKNHLHVDVFHIQEQKTSTTLQKSNDQIQSQVLRYGWKVPPPTGCFRHYWVTSRDTHRAKGVRRPFDLRAAIAISRKTFIFIWTCKTDQLLARREEEDVFMFERDFLSSGSLFASQLREREKDWLQI